MLSSRIEDPEQRDAAERAIAAMVDALALAGLPTLVALSAGRVTPTSAGLHVELGGCSVRTLQAIADHLAEHTRCAGRVVPSGLAHLPDLRRKLST